MLYHVKRASIFKMKPHAIRPSIPAQKHNPMTITLVVLVWVVLFMAAAEILLRTLCTYCTWTEVNGGKFESPYAINESSWYFVRPSNSIDSYHQPEFDYEIRTNSLGFRDIEHPLDKAFGETRILAIGDSFTEGQGAPFDQTWLSVMGHNMNRPESARQYTMIAAGVAGSDPFYEYRILLDKLLVYQPDIVMMVVNRSDANDVIVRGGEERFLPNGRVKGVEHPSDAAAWLYKHSHFARFILLEVFDYTHLLLYKSERGRRAMEVREKIKALIVKLDNQLKDRAVEFVLVVLPSRQDVERDRYNDLSDLQDLLDYSRARGIRTNEVKPYLMNKLADGSTQLDKLFWRKDYHFTPLGYRYVGEAVQEGLCSQKQEFPDLPCLNP
jgi:lysophospholipase L1-like esterase